MNRQLEIFGAEERLEDVAAQMALGPNVGMRDPHTKGWHKLSAGLLHAKVSREAAPRQEAPAPAPVDSLEAPVAIPAPPFSSKYEPYRIVLDYQALVDGFWDRIDELNVTLEQIDMAGDMASGMSQKLLSKNPGKRVQKPKNYRFADARRTFGWKSLGKMLKATGLALVLVVDDERFAPVRAQMTARKRPPTRTSGALLASGPQQTVASTKEDAANETPSQPAPAP